MAQKQLPSGIEIRIRQDLSEGSRGGTTLIIEPIITKSGYRVVMSDIGDIGFGKIDQNTPREEIISWTGITDNGSTYTLTGVTWGINFHNRTGNVSANMKRHISGASFSINTDMHYIAQQLDDYVLIDDFNVTDNSIGWGDGTTDFDKVLEARNGTVNLPFIKYDETENKWLISNDGVNTYDITSGGSGLESGIATQINSSKIDVLIGDSSGLQIVDNKIDIVYQDDPALEIDVDNKLGVKIKEDTGLIKDSDGLWCDNVDPYDITPQVKATLVGGTDVNFQNFTDIAVGVNNAKFSVEIDGVQHNDLSIDLLKTENTFINQTQQDNAYDLRYSANTQACSQSFTTGSEEILTSVTLQLQKMGSLTGNLFVSIYNNSSDLPTGTPIKTLTSDVSNYSSGTYVFDFNTYLQPNTKYVLVVWGDFSYSTTNYLRVFYNTASAYSGGTRGTNNNGSWSTQTGDHYFIVKTRDIDVVTELQSTIRAATGKGEVVTFDGSKFTISAGGRMKSIGKFQSPSTGTDISGAGYLDLGVNAVFTAGDGEDYRLVMTDEDGKIPQGVSKVIQNISTTVKSLNTVYQNTTTAAKMIIASVQVQGSIGNAVSVSANIGITNTPSTTVAIAADNGSGTMEIMTIPMTFVIPSGYYYELKTSGSYGGTPAISSWFECDLI